MRILHVIPSIDPATGGPVEGLRQLCAIYRAGGHEVDVASMDSPEFARGIQFPAPVVALGPGLGTYGFARRAAAWIRNNLARYDVVIIDGIWQYNAVAAYRALAGSGTPYALFAHGMLDPYFKEQHPLKHLKKVLYWHGILRRILRDATAVIFTCEEEKLLARQSFSRYSVNEAVIPFGSFGPDCDIAAAGEEFLARWPDLRGKRLAISLGRIHHKKGTDLLIKAFAGEIARDPTWRLVIAGPDQVGWQKELEALANSFGVADRITWTGMLKGTIKWGAFAASEVFVLPSHQENFGIVVAEALSCGLPVIVSNRVNIWREIEAYEAGLVCEDTFEGTSSALRRWLQLAPEEIADLRGKARRCFDEQFNFSATSKKVLETIERVAGAKISG
jgi:glycosyltransferase involved in cell wall biosynthesis